MVLILKEYLVSKDDLLYKLHCFSIMPNHVHLLFEQKTNLPKIMHDIKGGSAFLINKFLNRSGKFWEKDYFDRYIRNQKHFISTYEYIKYNPIKANLKDSRERFYSVYE